MGFIDSVARTKLSIVVIAVAVLTILRLIVHKSILNTPPHLRGLGSGKINAGLNELLDAIIYAGVFVFLVIRPFVLQTFYIPSGSMVPTLLVNDLIIANKFVYRFSEPKRGDIIVFKPPKEALREGQAETDFIKRLVGLPGDTIEFKNNTVYRNGKAVDEPFKAFTRPVNPEQSLFEMLSPEERAAEPVFDYKLVEYNGKYYSVMSNNGQYYPALASTAVTDPFLQAKLMSSPPAPIPAGHYLMIGDNRNNSLDGRFWGLIKREDMVGKAEVVLFPIKRFKRTQ